MPRIADSEMRIPQRDAGPFCWSQRRVGWVDVICLAGELDLATAEDLRERLMSVVESGAATSIVLDFSDVGYVDARSVDAIVTAWTAATSRGRRLQVEGLHGMPAMVFRVLGLESLLVTDGGTSWREAGLD
ncbi:STAS domain-containing protein [Actinoplanes sp. TBRC 11911]|uniref:STAS domain-containing protein n=1 Tax=Actinoplanes sp. TBRC 11911 TaxID=2729386 RepID=UPI00145F0656|nr:STAS domain-containing protein [Actinoplanes sp. TBRC 11911]NMO55166.1 STAS domain-containing protein [Actinoplanes sp. TBRC 11911]